jgi:hypothetical protein
VILIAAALRLSSRSLNASSRFASIKRLTVSFIVNHPCTDIAAGPWFSGGLSIV